MVIITETRQIDQIAIIYLYIFYNTHEKIQVPGFKRNTVTCLISMSISPFLGSQYNITIIQVLNFHIQVSRFRRIHCHHHCCSSTLMHPNVK